MNKTGNNRLDLLRRGAFLPLSFLAIALIGIVTIIGFVEPGGSSGIVEIAIGVATLLNLFYYLLSGNIKHTTIVLNILLTAFLALSIYTGMASRIGIYWLVITPVIVILSLGRKYGSILVGLFITSIMPAVIINGDWQTSFTSSEILSIMFGIFLMSTLLYYYDYLGDKNTQVLNRQAVAPQASIDKEIAGRQKAEANMSEALEKLAENSKKFEQISAIDEATISSIGEAVLVVDPDGKISRANPSSGRVLGVNQKDLLGQSISTNLKLTTVDKDELLKEQDIVIYRSISHRSIDDETYKITRPDNSVLYAQMTASPLVVSGEVYGAVVVVRDVTQEVVVDQAKSEFVSIASHQLRTPLSTINWYLEMVLAGDFGDLNGEQSEFITEAYDAGKRMGDLINALLNASRLDVGVVAVDPTDNTDIRDILKGVVVDLEAKLVSKNIGVKVNIDESVKATSLDIRIMEIIFLNLLTNAVKYSPENSTVQVNAVTRDSNIYIAVVDRGYGIPLNVQDKIFTKMFRADNAIEHEPDGNGLGLYIIKTILNTIGGSINFVSKEGEGTTFTVIIPAAGMKAQKGAKQLSIKPELN